MQPKARRIDIIAKEFDGDCVLFDEQTQRVHELNAAAASVWRHADGETSIAGLTAAMAAETGLPADEEIVHLALAQLSKAGLLEGPQSTFDVRISRRQITHRLGLTGSFAVVLPLVSSIVAPTPAMAQSDSPTMAPTLAPTLAATVTPTLAATMAPTLFTTLAPTMSPTRSPTRSPTSAPTSAPTIAGKKPVPTRSPTPSAPTSSPTTFPTTSPTSAPTPAMATDDG